jgi:hypothetical protein
LAQKQKIKEEEVAESDDDHIDDDDEDGYNAEGFSGRYGWYKYVSGWHKDRDVKQESWDCTPH